MRKAFFLRPLSIVSLLSLLSHLPGRGEDVLTANFDTLQEGTAGEIISDGGLTFSRLDNRLPDFNPPGVFVVDRADLDFLPPFSSPNVLNPFGYVPGPAGGYGRFGSAWIDFDGAGLSASLDVFAAAIDPVFRESSLSLQGWAGGNLVSSSSISFIDGSSYHHLSLVSPVPFDSLRLNASGLVDSGVLLLALDNVSVTLVPEPTTVSLLGLTLAALGIALVRSRRPMPR